MDIDWHCPLTCVYWSLYDSPKIQQGKVENPPAEIGSFPALKVGAL